MASVYFTTKEKALTFKEELDHINYFPNIELKNIGNFDDNRGLVYKLLNRESNNQPINREEFRL